jgi:hypothetical protein
MEKFRMRRPVNVTIALGLIVLGLALTAVSVTLNIVNAPQQYSRPFMIGYSAFWFAISVGLAYMIYCGKNWARLVYSVLAALALTGGLSGPNPAGVHHPFVVINHWCSVVIAAVVLILLFLPSSNRWFKANGLQPTSPTGDA